MTATDTAPPAPTRSFGRRAFEISELGPLLALILACLFFKWQADTFFTLNNGSKILGQMSYLGILAIGQTLIILTAGIDLSVGLIMAMGGAIIVRSTEKSGLPVLVAVLLGLAVCTLLGLLNGLMVQRLGLPPFVATLGLFGILYMVVHVYMHNQTVGIFGDNGLPDDKSPLLWLGRTIKFGSGSITFGTVLALVLFAVFWFILGQTAFGRHLLAFGNDPEAARLTGIRTDRLQVVVYGLAGLLYGIAALVYVARIGAATAQDGQQENLEVITAVVIGGTSLFGGRGTVIGTLIGSIIVFVFRNGLVQMGVASEIQWGVTGALLIIAVAVDQMIKKRR